MANPTAKIGGNAYQCDACLDDDLDEVALPRSGVRSLASCVCDESIDLLLLLLLMLVAYDK